MTISGLSSAVWNENDNLCLSSAVWNGEWQSLVCLRQLEAEMTNGLQLLGVGMAICDLCSAAWSKIIICGVSSVARSIAVSLLLAASQCLEQG